MNSTRTTARRSTASIITSTSRRRAVTRRKLTTTPRITRQSTARRKSTRKAAIITSTRAIKLPKGTIIITITTRSTARKKSTSTGRSGATKKATAVERTGLVAITSIIAELRKTLITGKLIVFAIRSYYRSYYLLMIFDTTVSFRIDKRCRNYHQYRSRIIETLLHTSRGHYMFNRRCPYRSSVIETRYIICDGLRYAVI